MPADTRYGANAMPILVILHYLPALLCGIHAVRTGRTQPWLWLLFIGGSLGAAVYFFAVILPEWMGGSTARRVGKAAIQVLDPEGEYRAAAAALVDTPSVQNNLRVGHAAFALGRFEEAEIRFREATSGSHADDPDLIVSHAKALLELSQWEAALDRLETIRKLDEKRVESAGVALLFARAYEGLGRNEDAEAPFRWAADRFAGLEAGARYCAFLAKAGRTQEAALALAEIERRFSKIAPALRGDAKPWRDFAAEAVAQTTKPT
jgi:hypothetical protein